MPGPSAPFNSTLLYRLVLLAATAIFLAVLWHALCLMPLVQWNPARLSSAFALSRGLPLYALRDSGAHLGWFYGPIFPIWHLPATLFSNPTHALVAAGAWNILTWLIPIALVLRVAGVGRYAAATGTLLAALLMVGSSVTNYGIYFVHVDAVCLALQFVACVGLFRAVRTGGRHGLHLCAFAVAAAVWTKVIALFLVPALLCWLWHERRRDLIRPFLFWCLVYGGTLTALILAAFGAEEVLFNVWFIHAQNPWRGGLTLLASEVWHLASSAWVWLPAVAFAWWLHRTAPRGSAAPTDGARPLLRLLLWAALWLAPLGLTAVLKAGGGLNSLHSTYYLFVAGMVVLTRLMNRPAARSLSTSFLFLLATAVPAWTATRLIANSGMRWTPDRTQEELLTAARREPGRYYFPWSPMITIIAENRISPLDDALYCLWLSKLEPPEEKIRAAVPAKPIIMYVEPAQSRFALRYFKSDPATDLVEPKVAPETPVRQPVAPAEK
jgi:hypothetical protein